MSPTPALPPGEAADPHPVDTPREPRRSAWRGARDVLVCSLAVTALAALTALAYALVADVRWSLAFVILRWLLVAALLVTPLAHQITVRMGAAWRMPWALRTPATALLLTCESICFDIVSARLG